MLQDRAQCEANYQRFLKRVIENQFVWHLEDPNGNCASSESNEHEDTTVLLFWSDEPYAKRHAVEEWSSYKVDSISVESFIDNWLKGMNEDGLLVGPNWDANLFGLELEPIDVAKELIES